MTLGRRMASLSAAFLFLFSFSAFGQEIQIASFNIKFLGHHKKRDNLALAAVVKGFDIVLVQELVAPPLAGTYPDGTQFKADLEAKSFLDEMTKYGYRYVLSPEDTGPGKNNHSSGTDTEWFIAFYNPKRVSWDRSLPDGFLAADRTNNPDYERVPYAFGFRADDNTDFVLISVHLKPNPEGAGRRKQELSAIAHWIDMHDEVEKDFIIVGDMNLQDCGELQNIMPQNFVSLNSSCMSTNTSVRRPRPYSHVMYRPEYSTEIRDNFRIVDLVSTMKTFWHHPEHYPGDPYDHNRFSQYYSDHHPIVFRIDVSGKDDD